MPGWLQASPTPLASVLLGPAARSGPGNSHQPNQTNICLWTIHAIPPSFAPQLGAILLYNPLNVGVNLFRRIAEPPRENRLLAGRVGCHDQTKVSMEERLKLRQVCDSTTHVFVNIERMGDAEMLRSRRHQLHQAHRALRGHHAWLPGRFDLNDRTNKSRRNTVFLGVVLAQRSSYSRTLSGSPANAGASLHTMLSNAAALRILVPFAPDCLASVAAVVLCVVDEALEAIPQSRAACDRSVSSQSGAATYLAARR